MSDAENLQPDDAEPDAKLEIGEISPERAVNKEHFMQWADKQLIILGEPTAQDGDF